MIWTTLAHHIDLEWLHEAYRRTRKDGAAGIDGVRAREYEAALEANLTELLEQFKTGSYRAPAVRRVHIPKEGAQNKTRPIGIPTLSDKVLQRAVLMVLEPVYEQEFMDCSYGFRPGRGAHQALDALWKGLMGIGGGWVIDLDIQSFFDTVSRDHLHAFLDRRVRDGVIRRVIGKWLNAGVMEEGAVWYPEAGTPQGGVITPLTQTITCATRRRSAAGAGRRVLIRRGRRYGNRVADGDGVITDEHLFDKKSNDTLTLGDV
jgi:group II intron reverse transcriptase/maturase